MIPPSPSEALPGDFQSTARFDIIRRIGAGGMGVVYEAWDRDRNARVALKTLAGVDPFLLRLFKNEFRALTDISHPNLASLYELFSEGGQWFFSMEFVDGVHFLEHVRTGWIASLDPTGSHDILGPNEPTLPLQPPGSCDLDRLHTAVEQLAGAVLALHAGGIIHRDLKPLNVKVTPDGRVVVLDFGLAALATGGHSEESAVYLGRVGTLSYMSPEQALGDPLTDATDWYAIGVMTYEAITGHRPFEGTAGQVLDAKRRLDAPALPEGTPEIWSAICAGLLERDPTRRLCGTDLLALLRRDTVPEPPRPAGPRAAEPLFVGREQQLGLLREAFAASESGAPAFAFLHGKSGMGKSSLMDRFLREIGSRRKIVILSGRCYERESMPYKAFDSVIDSLARYLARLPQHEAAELTPRHASALTQIFPALAQVGSIGAAPKRSSRQLSNLDLRRHAFGALRELLGRLSDRTPVILTIDDLQWGDTDSAELLAEILRQPEAPPILVIGSCRDGYEGRSPFLDALLENPLSSTGIEIRDIPLGPLSADEMRSLALRLLGREDAGTVDRADAIANESEGNPYFIQELVRLVSESEPRPGASNPTLDSMVYQRVTELDDDDRRLLEIIAVAGRPIDQSAVCRAAQVEGEGPKILSSLRVARLVRGTSSGEIETWHDRVREAVVAHLDPADLRQCCLRLATTLESSVGSDNPAGLEAIASYFEGAGIPARAASLYRQAAGQAARTLAFKHAATLYQRALDLAQPEDPGRPALLVSLAEALANSGRGVDAARAYGAAAAAAPPSAVFELQRKQAYWFAASGHVDEGRAAFQTLLRRVNLHLPGKRTVLFGIALRELHLLLRGVKFRERPENQIPPAELERVDAAWDATRGFGMIDVPAGIYFTTRSALLSLKTGDVTRIGQALVMRAIGAAAMPAVAPGRTDSLLAVCQSLLSRNPSPTLRAYVLFGQAFVGFLRGHWRTSGRQFREAEQIFREDCPGAFWELATCNIFSLWDDFYCGNLAELRSRAASLYQASRERGDLYESTMIGGAHLSLAKLAVDKPDVAMKLLDESLNQNKLTLSVYSSHSAVSAMVRARILLYRGDASDSFGFLTGEWPLLKKHYYLRLNGVQQWLWYELAQSALGASLNGGPPHLLGQAERAAKHLERDRMRFSRALAPLIRAGCAACRGDGSAAAGFLETAVDLLRQADMKMHAAAAKRTLGGLKGGPAGATLVSEADQAMTSEGVVDPARYAAMLVNGFTRPLPG